MVPKPTNEQGAEHIASEDIDVMTMQYKHMRKENNLQKK